MTEERVKYALKRLSALKDKRKFWEPYWDKAAELCSINSRIYIKDDKGRFVQKVFDTTARSDLTRFAAALKSILVPSNQRYHRIKASRPGLDDNDAVRRFLEYVNNLLFKFRYAAGSSFSSEADMMLTQLGLYGQSPWLVEDNVGRGISYRTILMAEIYCDVNRFNQVDTVYREYEMSLRQAIKEFGSRSTAKMKERFEKQPDSNVRLLHVVEPREDRKPLRQDYSGMPFVSYHINLDDEGGELIYESGYRTQPYMVPHYLGIPGSAYGDSPALQAFFDILTINEMSKTVLRTGQLQGNPPILSAANIANAARAGTAGALIPGAIDIQGRPLLAPMQYGNNLSITLELQNQVREAIHNAFLQPLFLSLAQTKEMTAEEARLREQEKAMLLAPMGERINSEWMVGNCEREIDIIREYGLLDEVPDELMEDGSLQIEFESPLVHMQQAGEIKGVFETLESAMSLAQVDPTVLDRIDMGEALTIIANYKGVPSRILRTPEQIQALGEARAQQQQAEQLLQAAPVLSQSMKNLKEAGA